MVSLLLTLASALSILKSDNECNFTDVSSIDESVYCTELYSVGFDKNLKVPLWAVTELKAKVVDTPVLNRTTKNYYNYITNSKKLDYKDVNEKGLDYAHLISAYNASRSRFGYKYYFADINRVPMQKTFNRTGLWAKFEELELQSQELRGLITSISGYIPEKDVFYKILYDKKSNSVLSLLANPKKANASLRSSIVSLATIESLSGRRILSNIERYNEIRLGVSLSEKVWATSALNQRP